MNLDTIDAILARSAPVPDTGCWLWSMACDAHGYGSIRHNGVTLKVHRVAYQLAHGPIPSSAHVLHSCDVPSCVNPAHLSIGTNADNIADSMQKGRRIGVTRRRPSGLQYERRNEHAYDCARKVKAEDRHTIAQRYEAGETQKKIADEYGVDPSVISRIVKACR